ncbi:MAG: tRNA epoxyqueuosine(34) reductase QueG [Planctomycetota bacterium]|nr:tRNA epoxyqueuosine(34) reductase QueG [Planctomycetota bacterium]
MTPPPPTSTSEVSAAIRAAAREVGFDLVGITPAVVPGGFSHLVEWISQGYHGEMSYIPRREAAYGDLSLVLHGARSVIALGMSYNNTTCGVDEVPSAQPGVAGRVARYAQGERDYHDLIRERLHLLIRRIREIAPGAKGRGVVDTAPVLERDFARSAGLGWFGKNTLLINKRLGSWFFLAAVLVDIELEYDSPHSASHCGTCTRCLDACPTDAFVAPYVLDARKCISYLTIELRGTIAEELRGAMGDWLFGCDVCQDVCPWNRKAATTLEAVFRPRDDLAVVNALELLGLSEEEFQAHFAGTPLDRPGRDGLRRNAAIAIGNSGNPANISHLAPFRNDPDSIVRETVEWAIERLEANSA